VVGSGQNLGNEFSSSRTSSSISLPSVGAIWSVLILLKFIFQVSLDQYFFSSFHPIVNLMLKRVNQSFVFTSIYWWRVLTLKTLSSNSFFFPNKFFSAGNAILFLAQNSANQSCFNCGANYIIRWTTDTTGRTGWFVCMGVDACPYFHIEMAQINSISNVLNCADIVIFNCAGLLLEV